MAGRSKDPFTTLGDGEFPAPDEPNSSSSNRDDEYRSLRGDEIELEQLRQDLAKNPPPSPPLKSGKPGAPPASQPKTEPIGKPKDQFTRVGETAGEGIKGPKRSSSNTPRGLGETVAPEGDDEEPTKPAGKKSSLVTPAPGKHRLDESQVSKSVLRTGRGGSAPQNGDDLAALLLDAEIVSSEDWEIALDKTDNNLANVPAILKQLSQQKASWTDDFPEHFTALTEYQVREIWAGRGLGLRAQGEFVILDVIGEGGMGKVYKARGLGPYNLPKIYAIKTIRADNDDDQTMRGTPSSSTVGRFRQEAQVLAKLEHPHLPRIYASDMSMDGVPFIVMDFLKGPTLEQIVKEKIDNNESVDWKWATQTILVIADVLQHAHTHKDATGEPRPVIHRDIKPANIIMKDGKTPMLVDLGIAKFATSNKRAGNTNETAAKGGPLGTPAYMPFEQWAEASNVTAASDIYSLAGTFYNLLTGELPFPAEDSSGLMYQVMTAERPKVSAKRKDVPKELDDIIAKSMAIKPEDRYETAQEFMDALRPFVTDKTGLTGVQKVTLAIAVSGLAAAIAFAAYTMNTGNGPNPELVEAQQKAPELYAKARKTGSVDDWKEAKQIYSKLAGFGADAGNLGLANVAQATASLALKDYASAAKFLKEAAGLSVTPEQVQQSGFFDVLFEKIPEAPPKSSDSDGIQKLLAESEKIATGDADRLGKLRLREGNVLAESGNWQDAVKLLEPLSNETGPQGEKAKKTLLAIYDDLLSGKRGGLTGRSLVDLYEQAEKRKLLDSTKKYPAVADAYAERWNINTLFRTKERSEVSRAYSELDTCIKLNPDNQDGLLSAGIVRVMLKQDAEAESYFDKIKDRIQVVGARTALAKWLETEEQRALTQALKAKEENGKLPQGKRLADVDDTYAAIRHKIDAGEQGKVPDVLVKAATLPPSDRAKAVASWAGPLLSGANSERVHFVFDSPKLPAQIRSDLAPFAASSYVAEARRLKSQNPAQAVTALDAAAKADPGNFETYIAWRDLLQQIKGTDWLAQATGKLELAEARNARDITAEAKKDWAPLYLEYGSQLLSKATRSSEIAVATAKLDRAIELDSKLADAYYQRALAYRKASATGNAVEGLKKAIADFEKARATSGLTAAASQQVQEDISGCYADLASTLLDGENVVEALLAGKKAMDLTANKDAVRSALMAKFIKFAKPRAGNKRGLQQARLALETVSKLDPNPLVDGWLELTKVGATKATDKFPDPKKIAATLDRIPNAEARKELLREFGNALIDLGGETKGDSDESLRKAAEAYEIAEKVDPSRHEEIRKSYLYDSLSVLLRRASEHNVKAFGLAKTEPIRGLETAQLALALLEPVRRMEDRGDAKSKAAQEMANSYLAIAECRIKENDVVKTFAACEEAVRADPTYFYSQLYLATAGLPYLQSLKDSKEDLEKIPGAFGKSFVSACKAIVLKPQEANPPATLLSILTATLVRDGKKRLVIDFMPDADRKRFVATAIGEAKGAFAKVGQDKAAPNNAKAALATAVAFLRLFGGDPNADEGFEYATKAAELSGRGKYLPLFLLAHFQIAKNDSEGAGKSLDDAQKTPDASGFDPKDIADLREKLPKKT